MPFWKIDLILLAFLSRSRIYVTAEEWIQTELWFNNNQHQDCGKFLEAIISELPFWKDLSNISTTAWQQQREQILASMEMGIRFCLRDDLPEHSMLKHLNDPPRCLSFWGDLHSLWNHQALAVVGSREASSELLIWLDRELSVLLSARPDLIIVSGGARGVDQRAHFTAIKTKTPTVVWLPSGLLRPYPPEVQKWKQLVLELGGCFVSEYHPLEEVKKWYFRQRNRLIIGMSQACFVPQSRYRSGSWMSATLAAEMGVPVFTTTALPWDKHFSGNTRLLQDGAYCLFSSQDLIDFFMKR
ncbi:MAG: DNA-protecting protein DprA [Bdellovibrionaceae bacterium]|nr:DNA-protecting protein DprA [Pseudobdellovibrionaceae bacterium]MDW8190238.1 DNA-processing protein DprA [Pseudobdellovibrionaceae bacterium]